MLIERTDKNFQNRTDLVETNQATLTMVPIRPEFWYWRRRLPLRMETKA